MRRSVKNLWPNYVVRRNVGTMTLAEYVAQHGKGAKRVLHEQTGLRWQTIHEIALGRTIPQLETAKKIEEATGGAVTALELLGLVPSLEPTGTDDV